MSWSIRSQSFAPRSSRAVVHRKTSRAPMSSLASCARCAAPSSTFSLKQAAPAVSPVNPFLRGFYFSGIRAHIVEDAGGPDVAAAAAPAPVQDAGATRIFSFNAGQTPAAPMQAARRRESRRVPQWVFLPHLLPRIVMADRTALDTSRASTKVNFVKRALIAAVAACFLLYLVCLTISYARNSSLEDDLRAGLRHVDAVGESRRSRLGLRSSKLGEATSCLRTDSQLQAGWRSTLL